MNRTLDKYVRRAKNLWARRSLSALYFAPGAFLILVSFAMVIMPSVFIFLMATLFLFGGLMMCYAAWRFLLLKKRVETIIKDVSGRVVIHGLEIQDPFDFDPQAEGKKIVYH